MEMANQTALITGASGGIGAELAKVFAREGFNLVLVARSEDKLKQLADNLKTKYGTESRILLKDLAQPKAPDEIFAELEQAGVSVDVLVNNAGFATYGYFHEIDLHKELELLQVNIVTLTHLSKLFVPAMLKRGGGKILNVASTAAFQPGPLMAVYYASKAYVLSLSEALAEEYRDKGITVTALCPGPTESGFQQRAAMEDSRLVQGGLMRAAEVAEIGYRALMQGKRVVVPGMANKLGALFAAISPRAMTTRAVMNMQRRVGH
jgi:short-subunit dehydrogenase